jgi:hypothetical protein
VWHETKDPSCKIEVGLVTKSDEWTVKRHLNGGK